MPKNVQKTLIPRRSVFEFWYWYIIFWIIGTITIVTIRFIIWSKMCDLDVCRLCLNNLYEEKQSLMDEPYHMMLETLAPIELNVYDQLSTVSCLPCIQKLNLFYTFRELIIKSDDILRAQALNKVHQFELQEITNEGCHNTPFNSIITNEGSPQSNIQLPIGQYETDNSVEPNDFNTMECTKEAAIKIEEKPTSIPQYNTALIITPTENVQCIVCLKDVSRNEIKLHTLTHYNTSQNCPNCNTILEDVTAYQQHIELRHSDIENTDSQCSQCLLSFKYKALYYAHIRAHYELVKSNILKQVRPGDLYVLPRLRSDKLRKSTSGSLKQCNVCYAFITSTNLHSHMKVHTTGPQVCELCGATAANEVSLRSHMHYTHSKIRVKCNICGQVFKRRYLYTLHQKKHENNKDHICDTCGKKFFTMYTLLQHMRRIHMKITRHTCTYCNKKFYSKFSFKTHLRQHTNETPYRCDVCNAGFKQNISLRNHRKSKHNIKESANFPCTECHKKFNSQHAVTTHMRVHT